MPYWSKPGRPKCFQPFVGGSETKRRGNLVWIKSKELCSWVRHERIYSTANYDNRKHLFCQHHLIKKRKSAQHILNDPVWI